MMIENNATKPTRGRLRDEKPFLLLTFALIAAFYVAVFCAYVSLTCPKEAECRETSNNSMTRYSYDQMARKLVMEASPYPDLQDGLKTGLGSALNHISKKIALQSRPHI